MFAAINVGSWNRDLVLHGMFDRLVAGSGVTDRGDQEPFELAGQDATIISHSWPSMRASTLRKRIGTRVPSVIRTESWLFFWIRRVNSLPSIFLRSRLLR